jgi:hypothetical protein
LTNLFNAVKHSYPVDAKLWAADLNKGLLTTKKFLSSLSTLANTEKTYSNMVVAKVETKNVKTENGGEGRSNNGWDLVPCDKCTKKIVRGWKHFPCGHHRAPDTPDCWWCDPEKAPDGWRNKKKAMEEKNKAVGGGTTAAVAGNNTNLHNPATAAGNSNLLFGLGGLSFDDDFLKDFH